MLIYVILVFTLITMMIIQKNKKNNKTLLFFILFIIVMQGIRSFSVGTDLETYEYHFNNNVHFSFIEIFEIRDSEWLYHILNKVIGIFNGSFRTLLIIVSLSFFLPYYELIKTNSNNYLFSLLLIILLGLFSFTFSGLRQTIAIGITIMAFKQIKEKKITKFICLVIIAMLFHKSAFIFFFAYPIYYFRLTRNKLKLLFIVIVPIFMFRFEIITFLTSFYDDNYTVIYTRAYNFLLLLLFFLILSIMTIFNKQNNKFNGLINFLIFSIFIQLFSSYSHIVMRFNYYYIVYLTILIPEIIITIKDIKIKIFLQSTIIIFLTITYLLSIKESLMGVYPYKVLLINLTNHIYEIFRIG